MKCYVQKEPARKLPNLKMPILVVMGQASYHAPYDHCTVKYLQQAGANPTFMRLADQGIKGNSHVMMNEKNNKEIAAAICGLARQDHPADAVKLTVFRAQGSGAASSLRWCAADPGPQQTPPSVRSRISGAPLRAAPRPGHG